MRVELWGWDRVVDGGRADQGVDEIQLVWTDHQSVADQVAETADVGLGKVVAEPAGEMSLMVPAV